MNKLKLKRDKKIIRKPILAVSKITLRNKLKQTEMFENKINRIYQLFYSPLI
jgi:hypothetical protein